MDHLKALELLGLGQWPSHLLPLSGEELAKAHARQQRYLNPDQWLTSSVSDYAGALRRYEELDEARDVLLSSLASGGVVSGVVSGGEVGANVGVNVVGGGGGFAAAPSPIRLPHSPTTLASSQLNEQQPPGTPGYNAARRGQPAASTPGRRDDGSIFWLKQQPGFEAGLRGGRGGAAARVLARHDAVAANAPYSPSEAASPFVQALEDVASFGSPSRSSARRSPQRSRGASVTRGSPLQRSPATWPLLDAAERSLQKLSSDAAAAMRTSKATVTAEALRTSQELQNARLLGSMALSPAQSPERQLHFDTTPRVVREEALVRAIKEQMRRDEIMAARLSLTSPQRRAARMPAASVLLSSGSSDGEYDDDGEGSDGEYAAQASAGESLLLAENQRLQRLVDAQDRALATMREAPRSSPQRQPQPRAQPTPSSAAQSADPSELQQPPMHFRNPQPSLPPRERSYRVARAPPPVRPEAAAAQLLSENGAGGIVRLWTSEDVYRWLCALGFGQLAPNFVDARVDGMLLLKLTPADIVAELGAPSVVVAKKLVAEVERLGRRVFSASVIEDGAHPNSRRRPTSVKRLTHPTFASTQKRQGKHAGSAARERRPRSAPGPRFAKAKKRGGNLRQMRPNTAARAVRRGHLPL